MQIHGEVFRLLYSRVSPRKYPSMELGLANISLFPNTFITLIQFIIINCIKSIEFKLEDFEEITYNIYVTFYFLKRQEFFIRAIFVGS